MARTVDEADAVQATRLMVKGHAELAARGRFPGLAGGAVVALKLGDEVMHRDLGRGLVTDTMIGAAVVLFRSGRRELVDTAELFLWRAT